MPITVEHEGKQVTAYLEEEIQTKIDLEVKGLKNKNDELKSEKVKLAEKLDGIEAEKLKVEKEAAEKEGNFQKLLEMEQAERANEQKKSDSLRAEVTSEKVSNAVNGLVTELGKGGQANADLVDLLKARFTFDYDMENKVVTVAGDGISGLGDLRKHVAESGKYDSYLAGSSASGGGASNHNSGSGASKKFGEMTGAELATLRKENPRRYEELRNEHHNS